MQNNVNKIPTKIAFNQQLNSACQPKHQSNIFLRCKMIKYNYDNQNEINNIYIHDSVFKGFSYDYENRKVSFSCENLWLEKKFTFNFNNVIYIDMQSCLFWICGCQILCTFTKENSEKLKQLYNVKNEKNYDYTALDDAKFISVCFSLNSGDELEILCETMEFDEENIVDKQV